MAVLAEYRAPARPGYAADALVEGLQAGSSIMARKQQLRLMEQQQEQQRMEFIAKLPLLQAQAQLEQANAAAAVKNATDTSVLEARAAAESVAAQKEFNDANTYNATYDVAASDGTPEGDKAQAEAAKYATQATWEERARRFAAISAKYAYMGSLKNAGYAAFLKTVDTAAINANERIHYGLQYDAQLARAEGTAAASIQRAQITSGGTVEAANVRAGASMYGTDVRAANRLDVVQAQGANQLAVTDRKGEIQANREGDILDNLRAKQVTALQDAQDAKNHGDKALAESFLNHAQDLQNDIYKRTNFAGGTSSAAPITADTPVPRRPSPASASSSTPVGISLSLPGYAPVGEGTAPVAAPTEPATPTQAATVPETAHAAPVKLGKWDQRNALKPGTKYIGPDGILYIKK